MAEDCSVSVTIQQLRDRILADSKRLYELTNPTEQELRELESDLNENPHVYASYLIEGGEGDYLWIALNVLDEREAQAGGEYHGEPEYYSEPKEEKEEVPDLLAYAYRTECCKACSGTGRVLESNDSVLKTTCMACLGTGRVDKQQQR